MNLKTVLISIFCFIIGINGLCRHFYDDFCQEECNCQEKDGIKTCDTCSKPCSKEKEIECVHGDCKLFGCICKGCWQGESCDQYYNKHAPVFSDHLYTKQVYPFSRGVLRGIGAFDQDRAICSLKKTADCPCSKVIYSVLEGGDSDRFQINPETGELAYTAEDIRHETELIVTLIARNIGPTGKPLYQSKNSGYAKVKIIVKPDIDEEVVQLREILPYPNTYLWDKQDPRDAKDEDDPSADGDQSGEYGQKDKSSKEEDSSKSSKEDDSSKSSKEDDSSKEVFDTFRNEVENKDDDDENDDKDDENKPHDRRKRQAIPDSTTQDATSTVTETTFEPTTTGEITTIQATTTQATTTQATTTEATTTVATTTEEVTTPTQYTVDYSTAVIRCQDAISSVTPSQEIHFEATITVPVGTYNISLSLTSNLNDLSVYHLCTIEDITYGSNIALPGGYLSTTRISTFDNFEVDTLILHFGDVTNSGSDTLTSFEPSQIRVNFTAIVLNNVNQADGDPCEITASANQDGTVTNYTVSSLPTMTQNLASGTDPAIQITGPTSLGPGQLGRWTISVELFDGYSPLALDLYGSGANPVAMCLSNFLEAGSLFKCYDPDRIKISPSGSGPTGFLYTFGELLNSDYLDNLVPASINKSVVIDVIGRIPDTAALGDSYDFKVDSYLNGDLKTVKVHTVNVAASSYTSTVKPTAQMSKFHTGTSDITKGSTVLVFLDIYIEPNTVDSYTAEITTTSGEASICKAFLISKGDNFPCGVINDRINDFVYTTLDNNVTFSSASVDMGLITNLADSNVMLMDGNKLTFGVGIHVPLSSAASSITVSADVVSDNRGTTTASLNLNVVTGVIAAETNTSVRLESVPPDPLPVVRQIADIVTWKVQIYFPASSDRYNLTARSPVSLSEAHFTMISGEVTYVGQDLSCHWDVTTLSQQTWTDVSNQQLTSLSLDLGFISYLGYGNTTDGNMVEVEFTFKVTDHPSYTGSTVETLTFDLTSTGGVAASTTGDVTVDFLGSEVTTVVVDTWCDDTFVGQTLVGDAFNVFGKAEVLNTSNAHASTVKFTYLLPAYVEFVALINVTDVTPTVTVEPRGVTLEFPLLTFEDRVNFQFTVVLDPTGMIEQGTLDIHTLIPVDITYMTLQKAGRSDTAVHYFPEPYILEAIFDVPATYMAISSQLQPCQWSASSEDGSYVASKGAPSASLGWRPNCKGSPFCGSEYLQVNFGDRWQVEGVQIFSPGDASSDYITSFVVQYSNTGLDWTTITDNTTNTDKVFSVSFGGGKKASDGYNITFAPWEIFTSRYIRIVPKTANIHNCLPALRVEMFGFKKSSDGAGCPAASTSGPLTVNGRTLVAGPAHIFVCMLSENRDDVFCSRSTDLGATWEAIDDHVANVIGIIDNTNTTVGISQNGEGYLCSYDAGVEWTICANEDINSIQTDPDYVASKTIPFEDISGMSYNNLKTNYGFTYGSTFILGTIEGVIVDSGSPQIVAWWSSNDWSLEL